MRRGSILLLAFALVAGSFGIAGSGPASADVTGCGPAEHIAGDWPSYGRNPANSRTQELETTIGPDNVGALEADWVLRSAGQGNFQSTAVIADGCLYAGTSTGNVIAANADTGEIVWSTFVPQAPFMGNFAPAVADGRVHVLAGQMFMPMAAALDQETGEILWQTVLEDTHSGFTNASAVVHDGLVFAAVGGRDVLDPFTRPAFFILDAETGEILKKTRPIPDEEAIDFGVTPPGPYGGGGIWTTAAIDTETDYLYAGTANPYSKRLEHERTNSILKIDMDRNRDTFGEIVGNYKGDADYNDADFETPQCQLLGDAQPIFYSIWCGQQDVDFGSSPNLWWDGEGRPMIGEYQKSGTYHGVDADTMEGVWRAEVSPPNLGGNAGTSAMDGTLVYVTADNGENFALDPVTGEVVWTTVVNDSGGRYQPMSAANGVVYLPTNGGELVAFDAATGDVLLQERIGGAGAECLATAGGGISIARNTLYIACDSTGDQDSAIFAYRL